MAPRREFREFTIPHSEAQVAISLVQKVQDDSKKKGAGISLRSYDRAAGREEQEALNDIGMVLATRARMDTAPG